MTSDVERQRQRRLRMREAGFELVQEWVPSAEKTTLKAFAASLRAKHNKEKGNED